VNYGMVVMFYSEYFASIPILQLERRNNKTTTHSNSNIPISARNRRRTLQTINYLATQKQLTNLAQKFWPLGRWTFLFISANVRLYHLYRPRPPSMYFCIADIPCWFRLRSALHELHPLFSVQDITLWVLDAICSPCIS
jgi:hypothetical protein